MSSSCFDDPVELLNLMSALYAGGYSSASHYLGHHMCSVHIYKSMNSRMFPGQLKHAHTWQGFISTETGVSMFFDCFFPPQELCLSPLSHSGGWTLCYWWWTPRANRPSSLDIASSWTRIIRYVKDRFWAFPPVHIARIKVWVCLYTVICWCVTAILLRNVKLK